ncbi:nucleotidyltransferase domain-containing protein [Streptomyces sp. NPDC046831]|uniref:nucleotidyltransferase domain-containing protein n=1 Tax=Streptomyces sp. NPDC046831 TaxID=3154805 RepID=UPI0034067B86
MQPEDLVRDHTIYACVMGSRAFGLATEGSDTDRRGVFVAPTALFWRFEKPPTHVEGPLPEQFGWELERFCELALRGNPNVLECLHSPLVEHADDTGRELLALRGAFLSRRVRESFTRYALAQRRRLEADLRHQPWPRDSAPAGGTSAAARRWKHAMHMLRLLHSARGLVRTGRLAVDVGDERERLLAVRRGEVPWPEVDAWTTRLAAETEKASHRTPLPPEPDRRRVEDFLVRVRRASALRPLPDREGVRGVVPPRRAGQL